MPFGDGFLEITSSLTDGQIPGNRFPAWVAAAALFLGLLLALTFIRRTLVKRYRVAAEHSATPWDDLLLALVQHTRTSFIVVVALFFAAVPLTLPEKTQTLLQRITVIALLVQSGFWCSTVLTARLETYRRARLGTDPAGVTTLNAIGVITRIALWTVVLLLSLDNLGVDITALIAGLGIGGIAVALAVQNILGDLLASLSIVLDKPFQLGDFLIVDDHLGSVEHIGLKTTRLRSLSGEQLVFANADLLNSRIRNYGRMFERRVVFTVGVTYQTPRDRLRQIPELLRTAVEAQQPVRFDRAHFKEYGEFSLNFETVYYILTPDYNRYMDIQQAINFGIHESFDRAGIAFAYPTRTVFLHPASMTNDPSPRSNQAV